MLIWKKCEFLWISAKKARIYTYLYPIHANLYSFYRVFRRIYLAYITQTPQINAPASVFDTKTNLPTQMNKKNLKNPKFPPIFKIPFLRNVNLRKLMVLNFDFQQNVLYALKWRTLL